MNLQVQIVKARDLAAKDPNGFSDPYAYIQVGSSKHKTSVIRKNLNPEWNQEFSFRVDDINENLVVCLWDEDRYSTDDFLGQAIIPINDVFNAENRTLPPTWFTLHPKKSKPKYFVSGAILLGLSLTKKQFSSFCSLDSTTGSFSSSVTSDAQSEASVKASMQSNSFTLDEGASIWSPSPEKQIDPASETFPFGNDPDVMNEAVAFDLESNNEDLGGSLDPENLFDGETFGAEATEEGLPALLSGGILLDEVFATNVKVLAGILFKPSSAFCQEYYGVLKGTDFSDGQWNMSEEGSLERVITYIKMVAKAEAKASKAIEEQKIIRADAKCFAVRDTMSTSDAPFKTELLFMLVQLPHLPTGEAATRLCISWGMDSEQSEVSGVSVSENEVNEDLTEGFHQFVDVLKRFVKPAIEEKEDPGDADLDTLFEGEMFSAEAVEEELPVPLSGGILLDQVYAVSMKALAAILCKPGSAFFQEFNTFQKTTEVNEGQWKRSEDGSIKRVLTYVKAASRLVRALKATEEQRVLRADSKCFAVSMSVSTPEAPYGSCFRVELLLILAPANRETIATRLCISWRMNFVQNTMMRGMIENGAKQGLTESFQQFADVLKKFAPLASVGESGKLTAEEALAPPKSDWEIFYECFGNLKVVLTILFLVLLVLHISLVKLEVASLEFWVLDFPDTFREAIVTTIIALLVEHQAKSLYRFFYARVYQASDHGVKATGNGWLLSVVLMEGISLAPVMGRSTSDPFVVFKCNGMTRTSSVKWNDLSPQWREIFEFDATDSLPSTMEVEVFHFEGPITKAISLGRAEINFLKHSQDELSDIWLPLAGPAVCSFGSRLHLRINLKNTKKDDAIKHYVAKMEKEVGVKMVKKSAVRNRQFQKIFNLPAEEFLLDDFSCSLKRNLPVQGRLFLSPRMLGFYSSLFGRKTRITFLWNDIEEICEGSPGNLFLPTLVFCMRKGRAMEFSNCAKKMDDLGRLHFQFQSFVKFGPACRIINALWKNRALSPEQRIAAVASLQPELDKSASPPGKSGDEQDIFITFEEANMVEVYFRKYALNVEAMIAMFENKQLDEKIMEKMECLTYSATPWESVSLNPNQQQRQQNFQLNRLGKFSSHVSCLQQKTISEDKRVCIVDEILTLDDLAMGDNFQLQVRKELGNLPPDWKSCKFRVSFGITWRKNGAIESKVSKAICEEFKKFLKDNMDVVTEEILKANKG